MTGPYYHGMCAAELAVMFPGKYAEVLLNAAQGTPGGAGFTTVTAPTGFFDFSMFSGGVAPISGEYIAFTPTLQWAFIAPDTQWRYSDRISA